MRPITRMPSGGSCSMNTDGDTATTTSSTPSGMVTVARSTVASPSRSVPCPTAVLTVTRSGGRRSHAQVVITSHGVTRTSRSGRFIATATTAPTTPSRVARKWAAVGRHAGQHGRPRGAGHDGRASRAEGVGTVARMLSTTVRPVTLLIHSSGRTVMRCERTGIATALTSSGVR